MKLEVCAFKIEELAPFPTKNPAGNDDGDRSEESAIDTRPDEVGEEDDDHHPAKGVAQELSLLSTLLLALASVSLNHQAFGNRHDDRQDPKRVRTVVSNPKSDNAHEADGGHKIVGSADFSGRMQDRLHHPRKPIDEKR